jgi:hypothetical protein
VTSPYPGDELVLTAGAWRPRASRDWDAFYEWAQTACSHRLVQAEAWPLLSDLLALRSFLRQLDDPDMEALGELAASFVRLPGEAGPLSPITFDIDVRHQRALAALGRALVACPAIYLVDTDSGAAIAGPAIMDWGSDPQAAHGSVLVRADPEGPPYSFFAPFDADGFRIEHDGVVKFRARRVAQERRDGVARLIDRDTGASVTVPGAVSHLITHEDRSRYEQPDHFHVETRSFPADYLDPLREDLAALVAAALETGHPLRVPVRFG